MHTPDEINMNAENAFLLREAAKAHGMGYSDHLANGGKGDPAEERWIEALNAGAVPLSTSGSWRRNVTSLKWKEMR